MIRIAFAGPGNIARVHARALAGPVVDRIAAGTHHSAAPDTRRYGMCGRLTTYPASSVTRLL
jgi:hypothetical protein